MEGHNPEHIIYLISGYNAKRLTSAELAELNQWVASDPQNEVLFKQLSNTSFVRHKIDSWHTEATERALSNIKQRIQQTEKQEPNRAVHYLIAALIGGALIALTIFYFIYQRRASGIITGKEVFKAAQNIQPGNNKAVLILDGGKVIDLSGARAGTLNQQDGISITKTANGEVVYNLTDNSGPVRYNTIQTPKGGQYQVQLPDGSKVWLNAASTLTYATNYTRLSTRQVTLSGEAYFEVAHNAAKPFVVQTGGQSVTVLGTHFNVSSYTGEPSLTTLLEGKVSVAAGTNPVILAPGQQSINSNGLLKVQQADTALAVAWKNGQLEFYNAELPVIMRQISRWYDIDVAFEGNISHRRFTGGINSSSNLAAVLQILAANDVNFEMRQMPNGKKALLVKEK